jgi:putative endonuclease
MDERTLPEGQYVYMLCCVDGTLYTGYTKNVERRLAAHNAGKGGHYTRAHRPVSLVAAWTFETKSEALKAEYKLKRLSRAQKLRLLERSQKNEADECTCFPRI